MSDSEDLRRIIERLDVAAQATTTASEKLALKVEDVRLLAAEDRVQISRLILLVQRLTEQGQSTLDGTHRLERTAAHVAEDLAAQHARADQAPEDVPPGGAADAALRSPGQAAAHEEEAP